MIYVIIGFLITVGVISVAFIERVALIAALGALVVLLLFAGFFVWAVVRGSLGPEKSEEFWTGAGWFAFSIAGSFALVLLARHFYRYSVKRQATQLPKPPSNPHDRYDWANRIGKYASSDEKLSPAEIERLKKRD